MESYIPPIISRGFNCSVVSALKYWIIDETHVVLGGKPGGGITPDVQSPPFPNSPVLTLVFAKIPQEESNECWNIALVELQ